MTTLEQTQQLLTQLQAIQTELDSRQSELDLRRRAIMAPVQSHLDDLEAEFTESLQTAQERQQTIKGMIEANIIALQQSVKCGSLQAVYSKPRIMWDTDKLEGFSIAYPRILEFRTVGKPSVSIRRVKE